LKYTINALKIYHKYILILSNTFKFIIINTFKYTKTILIYVTYIFKYVKSAYFNIHTYTFRTYCSTFQRPYIILTYITVPLLYSNIRPYTFIYVKIVLKPLHSAPLCLVTTLFFKTILAPHYFTKMSLHLLWHIFTRIQKWSIIHEFHNSYWLIKYLNPKLT
jgi:hypothetical protein